MCRRMHHWLMLMLLLLMLLLCCYWTFRVEGSVPRGSEHSVVESHGMIRSPECGILMKSETGQTLLTGDSQTD